MSLSKRVFRECCLEVEDFSGFLPGVGGGDDCEFEALGDVRQALHY